MKNEYCFFIIFFIVLCLHMNTTGYKEGFSDGTNSACNGRYFEGLFDCKKSLVDSGHFDYFTDRYGMILPEECEVKK